MTTKWSAWKWAFTILNYAWFVGSIVVAWFAAPYTADMVVGITKLLVRAGILVIANPYEALWWFCAAVAFFVWVNGMEELKVWLRDMLVAQLRRREHARNGERV